MDEEYDIVILGTGLTECILSGLFSKEGLRVLHIDRNDYYGGDTASLSLKKLCSKFKKDVPKLDAPERDWNVDLIPKFLLADGVMTQILRYTGVTRYLEFDQLEGSYFCRHKGSQFSPEKIPATVGEAFSSQLLGVMEKFRMRSFLNWVKEYGETQNTGSLDIDKMTMKQVYGYFALSSSTQEFIGHAMALYINDDYLAKPAREAVNRIIDYVRSVNAYQLSAFIYPLYGLGELPQSFARLAAVHGGTYMLRKPIDKVERGQDGLVYIHSGDEVAKVPMVLGDPSYFPELVTLKHKVVRAICIVGPNIKVKPNSQIIIPKSLTNRQHDIYIAVLGHKFKVAPPNYCVAMVATVVETSAPEAELHKAFETIGDIKEKFVEVCDIREPLDDGTSTNIYISKDVDETSHFESMTSDILSLYKRIRKTEFNLDESKMAEKDGQ